MTDDAEVATKGVKLAVANVWLQLGTVASICALIWVTATGWTDMGHRMSSVEANSTAANVAIAQLAVSVESLAKTTIELQARLNQALVDPWTGTDMNFWALRFKAKNPDADVPEVTRVLPTQPAAHSAPTGDRK